MKKTAKPAKKAATKTAPAKPVAKTTKKAEPKVKLSVSKKSEKIEIKATEVTATETTEEDEDDMEMAGGGAGNEAGLAMAAATADAGPAGSLKNFRHHPDIENFYRFIFENDLRYEALEIIDAMMATRATQKAVLKAKAKAH